MNKPLEFPFGFYANDNTPLDGKYFDRTTGRPYTNLSDATTKLPIGVRYEGLSININGIDYWWPANDSDLSKNPIIKTIPESSLPDGLIYGGEIDISDFGSGDIIVGAAQWLLTIGGDQEVYQTTTPTTFSGISLSSTGNQRYVAFFGDANGDIIKVEGTQSPAAVMPATPSNTVSIGHVLITDAIAEPPVIDLSGYAKLVGGNNFLDNQNISGALSVTSTIVGGYFGYKFKTNLQNKTETIAAASANFTIVNPTGGMPLGTVSITGFSFRAITIHIENSSDGNAILKHNYSGPVSTGVKILCPNNADYVIEPGETIVLSTNSFTGSYYIVGSSKYKIGGGSGLPSGGTIGQSIQNTSSGVGGWVDVPTKVQEEIDTKIDKDLPVHNTLQSLYDAILANEIVLDDEYKGNGAILYVDNQDIIDAEGSIAPNPPTNGIVDDINQTFTFTESI